MDEKNYKIKLSCLDKYDFLNILSKKSNEEFEVTDDAVTNYLENYSIYSVDNGWVKKGYASRRNQMSTSGCWLHCSDKKTIDIAGDILTS